jgi:hypothetical protein
MKHNPSNHTPFAKYITHAVPKQGKSSAVIEINAGQKSTIDVRFLAVALHYPYMFATPFNERVINRPWAPAFTQTCIDIDRALGNSTHGFCWRMLDAENGEPNWYWSLAKEYDQQLSYIYDGKNISVEVVNPRHDPAGELRSTIQAIVDKGKRRAMNWKAGAANDAHAFQPGGAQ